MRKVQVLHELQQVDTTLDRSRERLAAVVEQLADRSALAAVEAECREADRALHTISTEQRDLELQVQDLRDKLTVLEKKLYSGSVANPKELEAMTQDARQLRNQIGSREDRLIPLYDEVEGAGQVLGEASARRAAATVGHAATQAALTAERAALETSIAANERRAAELRAESDSQSLRTYDGLRRTRGGLAVAEVSQRTCQGCRVSLPINEEVRARSSPDLVFCQSCGRILHAGL